VTFSVVVAQDQCMGVITVLLLVVASASLACVSAGIRGALGFAKMTA